MTAQIIDGKAIAAEVREDARVSVEAFRAKFGRVPGLDVVLVGEDPASQVYTRNKERASNEVGMRGRLHRLPETATEESVIHLLRELADADDVDGILVQLPLPKGLSERRILDFVPADKDVDGFHPYNVGSVALGRGGLAPCTPLGCMRLIRSTGVEIKGANAIVVGRSNIVGKPVAQLLLAEHATVTIAHSRTKDLARACREADIVVAAVGRIELIRGSWIKPGAVVIDVGINRVPTPDGKGRLVGDVAFEEARERAGFITPVPGGVGPMTIAYLLQNTLTAATARERRRSAESFES